MQNYLEQSENTQSIVDHKTQQDLISDQYPDHTVLAHDLVDLIVNGGQADLAKRSIFYDEPLDKSEARAAKMRVDAEALYNKVVDASKMPRKPRFTPGQLDIIHACLGLFSETAEILESTLNSYLADGPIDITNLREELGDILWYTALATRMADSDFERLATANLNKLKVRYPDKFDSENALNRDISAEQQALKQ